MTDTEFSVTGVTGTSTDLPTDETVCSAFNFGDGIENVYTAVPGFSGTADTVTDTLVAPWGDLNLDSLFGDVDALSLLDPGNAFAAGLDAASGRLASGPAWAAEFFLSVTPDCLREVLNHV